MKRSWSKTEVTYLKRYARRKTTDELARKFETDVATVLAKLRELGIGEEGGGGGQDPTLGVFEKALKAMHAKNWGDAAKGFAQVSEKSEQIDLAERARQFERFCGRQLEGEQKITDPYLQAVVLRNRGELDEALAICNRGKTRKDDEGFAYLAASILSLQGELDASAERLGRAIELNPKNRIQAGYDADFEALRAADAYSELFSAD